jgi:hypothetical protein
VVPVEVIVTFTNGRPAVNTNAAVLVVFDAAVADRVPENGVAAA